MTDPAGTYSGPGASAPTVDPAGALSPAGAGAPMLAAAGTYIPVTGATSPAAELVDPAGTYSGPGASAPTLAQPGYYASSGQPAPAARRPTASWLSTRRTGRRNGIGDPGAAAGLLETRCPDSLRLLGSLTRRFLPVTITDPNIATTDSLTS